MRPRLLCAVALLALPAHAWVWTAGRLDIRATPDARARHATVNIAAHTRVQADRGPVMLSAKGKGLLLGHGLIVTSLQLVTMPGPSGEAEPMQTIEIEDGETSQSAELLVSIVGPDLALLQIPEDEPPTAPLGSSRALDLGDTVVTFSEDSESSGALTGQVVRPLGDHELRYLRVNLPLARGELGAPIFNTHGEVIGLAMHLGPGALILSIEDVEWALLPLGGR